jgi:hypothetical protein
MIATDTLLHWKERENTQETYPGSIYGDRPQDGGSIPSSCSVA